MEKMRKESGVVSVKVCVREKKTVLKQNACEYPAFWRAAFLPFNCKQEKIIRTGFDPAQIKDSR